MTSGLSDFATVSVSHCLARNLELLWIAFRLRICVRVGLRCWHHGARDAHIVLNTRFLSPAFPAGYTTR